MSSSWEVMTHECFDSLALAKNTPCLSSLSLCEDNRALLSNGLYVIQNKRLSDHTRKCTFSTVLLFIQDTYISFKFFDEKKVTSKFTQTAGLLLIMNWTTTGFNPGLWSDFRQTTLQASPRKFSISIFGVDMKSQSYSNPQYKSQHLSPTHSFVAILRRRQTVWTWFFEQWFILCYMSHKKEI